MSKSFVNIDKVILSKFGSNGTVSVQPLGLRNPAKYTIEDDPIQIELGQSVRNFTKLGLEAETVQCDYDMLKDFIEVYCVDEKVDAHIVTAAQQAATDSRGLKGNEVINHGWSPNGNGYAGFSFKYSEEYSSGTKKTSALVKLALSLEKDEAELLLATTLTNGSLLTDTKDYAAINPGMLLGIEYPGAANIFEKGDIASYKLEMESKGDGENIYGRPASDYLDTMVEIISKKDATVAKLRAINALAENSSLYLYEKLTPTIYTQKQFNRISRVAVNEISDKRFLKITFKTQIPILSAVFSTAVAGGITYKKMVCA